MDKIEIKDHNHLLAIIIPHTYKKPGISFFTSDDLSQQLAFMQHEKGHLIEPHVHNFVERQVNYTQEVLLLRKGKLRVDFYSNHQNYISSIIIEAGDVILLTGGGHGFEVLEDIEMIEVKQGPYAGDVDKTRFKGIDNGKIRLTE